MGSFVEGRNAVLEALRANVGLERVLVARGTERSGVLERIVRLAEEQGVPVEDVSRKDLDSISVRQAHQGVVAEVAPYEYVALADVLTRAREKGRSLILALDHITDPQNLGAIARSAEAVGADGIVIPSKRSVTVGAAALKASAGALMHIPVAREPNLVRVLEHCKEAGFWVAGACEDAGEDVWSAPLDDKTVLVLGSEGEGLSRLVAEHCDFMVTIPASGRIGSLNVAQACTVIAFEWFRRGYPGS